MSRTRDIGSLVLLKQAFPNATAIAGGTGDATEIDGTSIRRTTLGSIPESCQVFLHGNATMQSGKTLTLAGNLQDSPNDSDWTDFGTPFTAAVVLTGASGGGTAELFEQKFDVDIRGADDYIRVQATPNMDATDTDTAILGGVIVLGGGEVLPQA